MILELCIAQVANEEIDGDKFEPRSAVEIGGAGGELRGEFDVAVARDAVGKVAGGKFTG